MIATLALCAAIGNPAPSFQDFIIKRGDMQYDSRSFGQTTQDVPDPNDPNSF